MKLFHLKAAARILVLLFAVVLLVCDALTLSTWRQQTNPQENGQLGAEFAHGLVDKRLRIVDLQEDGALARAGAKVGDLIEFAHKGTPLRETFSLSEIVEATLYSGSERRQLNIRPLADQTNQSRSFFSASVYLLNDLIVFVLVVAIVVRKGGEASMLAFAISMLLMSPVTFISFLPASALQDTAAIFLRPLDFVGGYLFFLLFTLKYPAENVLFKRRFAWYFASLSVVFLLSTVISRSAKLGVVYAPPGLYEILNSVSQYFSLAISLASLGALGYSWYTSKSVTRSRIAWIFLSIGATYVFWIPTLLGSWIFSKGTAQTYFFIDVITLFAYLGFGYALLRHKIFDFGFVVNRTIVFSITSLLLFVAFWLIEQLVHKFVHFEAAEKNAMVGGAIAFSLFFVFNRLHHRVEHWVEHLFFKQWRVKEVDLEQFVMKAAHFHTIEALIEAFGAALERFTAETGNAIYLADADGCYLLAHSTLPSAPASLPVDDDIAVTLRSTRKHRQLGEANAYWKSGYAFPMFHGDDLNGIVILGNPAESSGYRPDQQVMLEFAISRISLEISSLQAKMLSKQLLQAKREGELWRRELEGLKYRLTNPLLMRSTISRSS